MTRNYTTEFFAGFIEASVTHTYLEHSAHGIVTCLQESVGTYWQYLGTITNHGEDLSVLTPTQRRHYEVCSKFYEYFEPIVADTYAATLTALPRSYACPVCKDEEPCDPPGPNDANIVDWDDTDE